MPEVTVNFCAVTSVIGAGRENRTPISSLENLHTNRCTIPAHPVRLEVLYSTYAKSVTFQHSFLVRKNEFSLREVKL